MFSGWVMLFTGTTKNYYQNAERSCRRASFVYIVRLYRRGFTHSCLIWSFWSIGFEFGEAKEYVPGPIFITTILFGVYI